MMGPIKLKPKFSIDAGNVGGKHNKSWWVQSALGWQNAGEGVSDR